MLIMCLLIMRLATVLVTLGPGHSRILLIIPGPVIWLVGISLSVCLCVFWGVLCLIFTVSNLPLGNEPQPTLTYGLVAVPLATARHQPFFCHPSSASSVPSCCVVVVAEVLLKYCCWNDNDSDTKDWAADPFLLKEEQKDPDRGSGRVRE